MIDLTKRLFAVAAVAALCVTPALAADMTLDQVMDKYYEARGGLDKIKDVKSARMTGKMMMGPQMEAPFVITWVRPDAVRMEFEIQGMKGVQAASGDEGWMHMPFMGQSAPQAMTEAEMKALEDMKDFDGALVDWKKKGHTLELVGKEEVEGTQAYKLKMTQADGDVSHHFIDAEHFVEIKSAAKQNMGGMEMDIESTMGDYKEVDGLMFAHAIEQKAKGAPTGQSFVVEKIELDVSVDPGVFAMPAGDGE